MEGLQELTATVAPKTLLPIIGKLVVRPMLWTTALRQARRLARRGWWHRPPFLPVPDARYAAFRSTTMYGGVGSDAMRADDVIEWLEWCRQWPDASR